VLRDYSVIEITDPQNVLVSVDDIQSENPQEQKDE
jgi:hypothetical protein